MTSKSLKQRDKMFKINKACDLSSISVLPPQTRRLSSMPPRQSSQPRSQPSQQSFSQGISSQHGLFSQLSQSSIDEHVFNNQRLNSQDRQTSLKKTSSLHSIACKPEESQMAMSRSSNNIMRKWSVPSAAEHKTGQNEELEHRIGMIETSINKFGMMLDSIQSDVMQVNRGTKEVSLELEGIRQKLIVVDCSLQQMNRGHEDVKLLLDSSLKSINEQLRKDIYNDKSQEILVLLSSLQEQTQDTLSKLKMELSITFSKEIQAISSSLRLLSPKSSPILMLKQKVTGCLATPQAKPLPQKIFPPKMRHATTAPNVETGDWSSERTEHAGFSQQYSSKKRRGFSSAKKEKTCSIVIESDEEMDKGFSCLIDASRAGSEKGNYNNEAREETERILRKARRQKRKFSNPIIIN